MVSANGESWLPRMAKRCGQRGWRGSRRRRRLLSGYLEEGRAAADEVAGEQNEVGGQRVDLATTGARKQGSVNSTRWMSLIWAIGSRRRHRAGYG